MDLNLNRENPPDVREILDQPLISVNGRSFNFFV